MPQQPNKYNLPVIRISTSICRRFTQMVHFDSMSRPQRWSISGQRYIQAPWASGEGGHKYHHHHFDRPMYQMSAQTIVPATPPQSLEIEEEHRESADSSPARSSRPPSGESVPDENTLFCATSTTPVQRRLQSAWTGKHDQEYHPPLALIATHHGSLRVS